MKKLAVLVAIVACLIVCNQTAKAQAFSQGTKLFTAGLRFQDYLTPVFVSAEFGVTDHVGVGGLVWFARKEEINFLAPSVFANYHFSLANEKLDPYAGAGIGIWRASYEGESDSSTAFTIQGGFRYYFTEQWGAKAQINIDFIEGENDTAFQLGVSYKF